MKSGKLGIIVMNQFQEDNKMSIFKITFINKESLSLKWAKEVYQQL